jgi:capsular polysaccharide transport system permease protein
MEAAVKWAGSLPLWLPMEQALGQLLDDLLIMRALILRSLRLRHANNPLGLFVEFLRPVAICLAHYYYFTLTNRPVPGHQYAIFTIGGFSIYFAFIAAYNGTYEGGRWPSGATQFPGVTRMHLRVANVLWAFVLHLGFAVAVVLPLALLGQNVNVPNMPLTIADFAMAVGLGFGYGLVSNCIGLRFPAIVPFLKITQWAVFITSGVYDSLVTMPPLMAQLIWYNPLIHLAEFQRYAYYDGYPTYLVSLTYPLVWMVGLILVGLLMNRALCNRKFH